MKRRTAIFTDWEGSFVSTRAQGGVWALPGTQMDDKIVARWERFFRPRIRAALTAGRLGAALKLLDWFWPREEGGAQVQHPDEDRARFYQRNTCYHWARCLAHDWGLPVPPSLIPDKEVNL